MTQCTSESLTNVFVTILMLILLMELTDCSSRRDSSECTALACLLQTLEASGRQHTWRLGYWGPAVSVGHNNG